ncbi:hypothetical protein SLEP1_g36290 [Rubroshorea leprosula]|uniref:DUF4283 domain-containing protein n=1 Tax=Rubroshorea leprosula TaxID=152421 RepID=A0AAV5KRD9_9ROSI|nr:hypothetical protein SLEP1_g36290 [Rubroshorea leprosula]
MLTPRKLDLQGIGLSLDEVPKIELQSCEVDTENVICEEILGDKLGSSSLVANTGPATGHGVGGAIEVVNQANLKIAPGNSEGPMGGFKIEGVVMVANQNFSTKVSPHDDKGKGKVSDMTTPTSEDKNKCDSESKASSSSTKSWPNMASEDAQKSISKEANAPIIDKGMQHVEGKRNWTEVVQGNHSGMKGLKLDYYPVVDGVVEFNKDEWNEGIKHWQFALMGYTIGIKPSFKEMVKFANINWQDIQIPKIYMLKNDLTRVPMWVHMPKVKFRLWLAKEIGKFASALGRPIMIDAFSVDMKMMGYVKVLVEMKVNGAFPHEIIVEPEKMILEKEANTGVQEYHNVAVVEPPKEVPTKEVNNQNFPMEKQVSMVNNVASEKVSGVKEVSADVSLMTIDGDNNVIFDAMMTGLPATKVLDDPGGRRESNVSLSIAILSRG